MVFKALWAWTLSHKAMTALILAAGLIITAGGGYLYWTSFAAIQLDESLTAESVIHRSGVCKDGDIGHECEGNVSIVEDNGSWMLYFEDYDATDGPDVWFYMTVEGHEGDTDDVEEDGLLILVPQTMEESDGKAEVEGTFIVPLPDDFDINAWNGLSVWCEDYNILMGSVSFSDVE